MQANGALARIRGQVQAALREPWELLKATGSDWADDHASRMGAALAYYSVYSLGPLIIIAVAIAGLVFGKEAAQGQLFGQLSGLIGSQAATAVQGMIAGAQKHSAGIAATLFSVVMLIITAVGVIVQLKDSLNSIWGVKTKPGRGLHAIVMEYVVSIAALLGFGFILMVSLLLTTALAVLGKYMSYLLPLPESVLHLLNFVVSFGILSLMFALMFKLLPDIKIAWGDVWVGAIGTAFLFLIGKTLIGLYLGKQSLDSTYGAAASLVAILTWVYYLSQVLFFGAEFTKVYARFTGSRVEPTGDGMIDTPPPQAAVHKERQGLQAKPPVPALS